MKTTEHLDLINETINKTKEQIRPLSVNFIFWGIFIIVMSFIHYSFPSIVPTYKVVDLMLLVP